MIRYLPALRWTYRAMRLEQCWYKGKRMRDDIPRRSTPAPLVAQSIIKRLAKKRCCLSTRHCVQGDNIALPSNRSSCSRTMPSFMRALNISVLSIVKPNGMKTCPRSRLIFRIEDCFRSIAFPTRSYRSENLPVFTGPAFKEFLSLHGVRQCISSGL